MSYHGHAFLRTLIRCHFSPAETTGGQYIYSGSADGKVHVGSTQLKLDEDTHFIFFQIWSLDGRVVQVLDRARTLPMTFDPSAPDPGKAYGQESNVCVRDVSWHSQVRVIIFRKTFSIRGN
jgi:WD repeat-containing protein 23